MKLAIVGGGWAGLSAAAAAVHLGHDTHLYESAATLGGRARSVHAPALDAEIDNGQHILLGAYSATLALMRVLGLDPSRHFIRLPLSVRSADGRIRVQAFAGLPAPLHIAAGLLVAKGLNWKEKRAIVRAITALRRHDWTVPRAATVQDWLSLTLQPARVRELLWIPLCIATLNTPAECACAQLFANVLRDSLGSARRDASEILIPRTGLTELWPATLQALARRGELGQASGGRLDIRLSTTIRALRYTETDPSHDDRSATVGMDRTVDTAGLILDGHRERYDAVVLCGNTPSTARLLSTLPKRPGDTDFLERLDAFEHAPIGTLTLELKRPFKLPAPMLLLHEDRARKHFGQWVFQGQDAESRLLHVVVSDAGTMMQADRSAAVTGMITQLQEQLRGASLPAITRHALIVEKRATFLSVPGLRRPGNRTPWRGVWVAGDWTDTGYPAVLEGAVRSGQAAIQEIHAAAAPAVGLAGP